MANMLHPSGKHRTAKLQALKNERRQLEIRMTHFRRRQFAMTQALGIKKPELAPPLKFHLFGFRILAQIPL